MRKSVTIRTSKPYAVHVGRGLFSEAPDLIRQLGRPYRKVAVVTDSHVAPLYLEPLEQALAAQGFQVASFVFPAGEDSKTLGTAAEIYELLAREEFSRSDLIIALGGGIPGDVAGYAAATYLRGIDYVQIPTTLLAAVDSSVGGKTAVNLSQGKNLVGAFHQPRLVVCDPDVFFTLPQEIFDDGTAEVIKYGVIWDEELFTLLEQGGLQEHLEDIICRCVEIKGEIVSRDETEQGLRILLNYGHTLAHGIEMATEHKISHGRAVAIGMAGIARLGQKIDPACQDIVPRLEACLTLHRLPASWDSPMEKAAGFICRDKKRRGDELQVVLAPVIGKALAEKVPLNTFLELCRKLG